MKTIGMIFAIIVAAAGVFYLLYAYAMVGWGWSDSGGHWTVVQWVLTVIPWSIPFLISLWIVYRCAGAGFKRALIAEGLGLALGVLALMVWMWLDLPPQMPLEENIALAESGKLPDVPELPLACPAVGVARPNGTFNPMMFLTGPVPRGGYKKPLLTFDLKAGEPVINIYRGTNALAADDHFLGRFQVSGYPRAKDTIDLMCVFVIDSNTNLLLQVRYVDATQNIPLKTKRIQ